MMARTSLRDTGQAEAINLGSGSGGKGNAGLEDDSGLECERLGHKYHTQ